MLQNEIEALFAESLVGDEEEDSAWEAVHKLRVAGTREIFDQAVTWCQSSDLRKRARGVDVLAQLGKTSDHPHARFAEESYELLCHLLNEETEPRVIAAALAALGHINNPLAVPVIASFSEHSSSAVRFDAAFALGCFPNDPLSVTTLIRLMQDTDADVRDWATFGLGTKGDNDSPEIRAALLLRLEDVDKDTRLEAIAGLAKRRDQRVLPALRRELDEPEITVYAQEAACLLLDLDESPPDWTGSDYRAALSERFPG